ncbi:MULTISPECIES: HTH-type transcriptional regulator SgrR [Klebsiella]|jgi:SgrR family transcriptional regulator|uniref:Transcriptional regulator SgrR n=1 Tax=Klebsiella aerogenes (strain ATCC 13048 / DSM 30053 / CCUG 1429 / JCM 1235 / KCTC 2190 / NBRC 13534 / NCIMB 10102 / NCTC 10006 / CDC 819-56) TaxID=1028307 RepID=A0A0H3FRQ0_KLEAK|nr:HTH-type transcriptional regulator SgrR [Klebsiella aerogenes]AEG97139.1 transcriptional regulator SgrR [Klebsiella aerogenes KCTC 2190]ATM89838.1 transcriptional regulator SgrR [Klebsiella aerogenes]EIV5434643.1 HTH-type transcriptional regulator SgrR [Klebsiella aerogenes]EIW8580688.1 HTH-type transcriptional regulator SgrR [Klebsiella aerogenes]EIX9032893.1 HTH-type transcriptional regulator SgrR [Klebsiella aerogenes]
MPSSRLQQQFIRLWQCCDGRSQQTTLNELAEMLSCSRRHMRTLLNLMEARGWLAWESEAGRGKRSRLTFLYTGLALQQQRAEDLLEQDRIDQLVQLVGDKTAVRQMLISHLGRSFRQGRHILRVLYYRPMKNLLPGSALRRSETHIARQIFSALTRVNEENGELEADIAHHWQQISPNHWRFFLRPGIHFHHGRELEMADVISSLQRSSELPLFSHIERIVSPTAWTLDIHLSQPDRWLPWLLGQVPAMALPQEWRTMENFSSMPIGTGPYAVARNNQNQLKIHAFEEYFGYRALIDEVNVWVLPEISEEPNGGLTLQGNTESEKAVESRLEEGCYYLLFDSRSPLGGNDDVRRWLSYLFQPANLLYHAGEHYQGNWFPAYGLLPRWHHARSHACDKPAGLESVTLTYYRDHVEHRVIGGIMRALLAEHQVRLNIQELEYDDWHRGETVSDIWLNSVNFTLPIDFSLFAYLYEVPLMHHCIPIDWEADANRWRAGEFNPATWSQQLLEKQHIVPLIHHWLMIQGQRSMRGVRMNTLGWFDFKSAWFAPPEP